MSYFLIETREISTKNVRTIPRKIALLGVFTSNCALILDGNFPGKNKIGYVKTNLKPSIYIKYVFLTKFLKKGKKKQK